MGLCPGGHPIAAQMIRRRKDRPPLIAYFYELALAKPKRVPTLAQEEALDKAMAARQTCPRCRVQHDHRQYIDKPRHLPALPRRHAVRGCHLTRRTAPLLHSSAVRRGTSRLPPGTPGVTMLLPLDLLVGPERAARVITERVRDLATNDLIPEPLAYATVCTAVLACDPWTLAETGQTWIPRDNLDVTDAPADLLYVVRRHGGHALLEDEYGQRETLPLSVLDGYVLDHWEWARTDTPATPVEET